MEVVRTASDTGYDILQIISTCFTLPTVQDGGPNPTRSGITFSVGTFSAEGSGTLAAPSVAVGATNLGLYSPSAGVLAASIAGVRVNFPTPAATQNLLSTGATISSNGLTTIRLPLYGAKTATGASIITTTAAGTFFMSQTLGTSQKLQSETANNNTKTDIAAWDINLPATYVAGSNVTVTLNCNYNIGAGTVGTHTAAVAVYLLADDDTMGSTLVATAAQNIPAAAGDLTFTITGTTLTPNCRLMLAVTFVLQETASSNVTSQINSIRLS